MLNLLHAYTGWPGDITQLLLPRHSFLLYPSGDTVVILDGRTLSLVRVLAFWEAFPAAANLRGLVGVVVADTGLKIILASMGAQVAFWTVQEGGLASSHVVTKVHSTLSLRNEVTAADCKSGLLVVGTSASLAVYTLTLENDIPTWIKKWEVTTPTFKKILFSPSLTHIASLYSDDSYTVRLYLTAIPRETQVIRHPRPIVMMTWRAPKSRSRPDLTLFTLTTDSTLRIFHPVLDAPQRLQLHAALDPTSFLPSPLTSQFPGSYIFPLDRQILLQSITEISQSLGSNSNARENSTASDEKDQLRKLEEIKNEEWDLFLRILKDGSIVIRGIANIDRRPPTLLKQFTLLHTPPSTLPISRPPTHLILSTSPKQKTTELPPSSHGFMTLTTCPPLATYDFEPQNFFDARKEGLRKVAINDFEIYDHPESDNVPIEKFVRSPNGNAVAVVRRSIIEAWVVDNQDPHRRLRRTGKWRGSEPVIILDDGCTIVNVNESGNELVVRNPGVNAQVTLAVPPLLSLFAFPPTDTHTLLIGVTQDHSIGQIWIPSKSPLDKSLNLYTNTSLPVSAPPNFILPVDPMAWSSHPLSTDRDVLLSISSDGLLSFWIPEMESSSLPESQRGRWKCTGSVHTGKRNIRLARCSSAKKTVLVVPHPDGEEITIWDSKESQFSTGLEYRDISNATEKVKDLDWTSTGDGESILAIGYAHHVLLLCQQRMTYFEQEPGWSVFTKVDISPITPYDIHDSIWLSGGSLLVAAGHQMYHFGQEIVGNKEQASLFELVASRNAPLVDYHPQMLLQCLLWAKLEYVKEVIVRFARGLKECRESGNQILTVQSFLVDHILEKQEAQMVSGHRKPYSMLFGINNGIETDDEDHVFSRDLVEKLLRLMETGPVPGLTPIEQAHLIVLIQTTLEVDEQRRALDSNGLRYLISMRSFYIFNQRVTSSKSKEITPQGRQRLRYRDMVWAFHSESQEILLSASTTACGGKMTWDDAKALGIYIWMESTESLRSHMETIARNEYMAGENRDPSVCALYYFALGKVRLVHGLWRQAAWHKEQAIMLKFLANDFQEPRWQTAALKNAFALLSKQRFAYAAAFFLLGGSLKDAVNVCLKNLDDIQLAIALARVVERSDDGPVFQNLLKAFVIPLAFKDGNRYLASWAFWKMYRRDLAVRVLLVPLADLAVSLTEITIIEIGTEEHYDDPSLALLFSQLKSKSLQTAKGTSEISGRMEFNFILQMARVFCRMGCHVLALDLTASWSFERPETSKVLPQNAIDLASSQTSITLPPIHRQFLHRRRSSMVIDMEIPSLPPTVPASPKDFPTTMIPEETVQSPQYRPEIGESERQRGLGSLLKTAKQDVTVPEFDMNAFF